MKIFYSVLAVWFIASGANAQAPNTGTMVPNTPPGCITSCTFSSITVGGGSAITSSGPGGSMTTLAYTAPGTGVTAALTANIGSAGAPVLFNGAGGTPSSLVGTNITGTASGLTVGNVTGLSITSGKTFTVSNTLTLTGTDGATLNIGAGGTVGPFTVGTTTITGGSTNGVIYNNAGVVGNLATAANGVLVTNSSSVPSISSTLPSGLTIPSPIITGLLTVPTILPPASTALQFQRADGTSIFNISTGGNLLWNTDNTYDLGASGASRPRDVQAGRNILAGNAFVTGSSGSVSFGSNSDIFSPSNGSIRFTNAAVTNSITLSFPCATAAECLVISSTLDATTSTGGAFQVAGGASVAKRFWLPAITASSGLQTAVLCQSSGGEVIADSVACLASSARFKDIRGPLPSDIIGKFMKLPIKVWAYKEEGIFKKGSWTRDRIGPIAEDVEKLDPRLVEYDKDGQVRAYSTEQLLAYTIKVVQEQQTQINNLRGKSR